MNSPFTQISSSKEARRIRAALGVVVYLGPSGSNRDNDCFIDQDNEKKGYKYMVQAENKVFFNDYEWQNNMV